MGSWDRDHVAWIEVTAPSSGPGPSPGRGLVTSHYNSGCWQRTLLGQCCLPAGPAFSCTFPVDLTFFQVWK